MLPGFLYHALIIKIKNKNYGYIPLYRVIFSQLLVEYWNWILSSDLLYFLYKKQEEEKRIEKSKNNFCMTKPESPF